MGSQLEVSVYTVGLAPLRFGLREMGGGDVVGQSCSPHDDWESKEKETKGSESNIPRKGASTQRFKLLSLSSFSEMFPRYSIAPQAGNQTFKKWLLEDIKDPIYNTL